MTRRNQWEVYQKTQKKCFSFGCYSESVHLPLDWKKHIRANLTECQQYRTPTVSMRAQPEEIPNLKSTANTRASDDVRVWLQEVSVKRTIPGSVSLSPPLSVSLCVRAQVGVSRFSLSTVPNLRTAATWGPGTTDVGWNNYEKNRRYKIQGWKLVQHCGGLKTQ